MKVGVFDEYGGLSVGGRGWGNCIQLVKRGWNGKKRAEKQRGEEEWHFR